MSRIGQGFDAHRFQAGRKLVLGGVAIDSERGLLGHSDADVICHAVCDALLGALALGDIGKHFPDSDMRYKGISSLILLEKVTEMVDSKGYWLGNLDIVVAAESPKISPYILDMRNNIASSLGADLSQISVKATTTEGLGFTGRGEGIAVWAVALLNEK
ncbi:2-C-methyl-D-erythritol 2,4-cyclodiphosphate synthase [hydrothermal vent metagenome]|uniref:2-C-methyl-D-erythritol 2,4-cyclodiphosphate synthase n=1 Tax=hydrothermal vent metagenome TaxID=652676 RepID=A0A3B1D2V5_9ZZZZ